jgi:hypothetical protein
LFSKDFEFLDAMIKLDLPAREFTIKIICRTVKNSRLSEREIRAFSDIYLRMIATKLIKDRRMNIKGVPTGRISFELFKQKLVDNQSELGKEILKSFASHLPWLIEFQKEKMPVIEKAEELLKKCGYRHTVHILKYEGFRIFADLGPRTMAATITKIWLRLTQQNSFSDELKERIQGSAMLKRRWSIIEPALSAHRDGNYVLSIPVLFAQIEGILGDALILNHKAISKGGKLLLLDSKRKIKMKNGRPMELNGISAIIDQPYFRRISRLEVIIKLLRDDKIVQERNAILHGRRTSYGRAKLSTQALLLIYALIRDAAEFESPIVISSN